MSLTHKGKKLSLEHRANISKGFSIPVLQFNIEGEFLKEFSSLKEAGILTNTNACNISMVCKGQRVTANKYKWKYKKS